MRYDAYLRHDGRYPKTGKPMPKQYAKPFSEIQLFPERLEDPLHIKTPQKIFVNSMADLFHSQVPDEYIARVFEVMRQADWHVFQILTKRAGRLRRLGPELDWPSNVWMGVSIETNDLSPRADALRQVPAAVRFLSLEPLLGPLPTLDLTGIHWVVTGGESGAGARYCDPDWIRDIRDRCVSHNVAFFQKQMGTVWARENHLGKDMHGSNMDHWPANLRIRQFPGEQGGA
jgi:protein gp37